VSLVSFTDYVPAPRFDDLPWTSIRIHESESKTGPWTLIDTLPLIPVDADPEHPQARSFSTDNAALLDGWYRVSFVDAAANVLETDPVQNVPGLEWKPTLSDLGHLMMVRTRDSNGNILGTFTADTTPTDTQAEVIIQKACENLRLALGMDIPDDLIQEAQEVTALRAAMLVELTYFPNEVAQQRSPYRYYKELFDEKVTLLSAAIIAEESGADPADALAGASGFPAYAYPVPTDWLGVKW
jgi:hypothetical protein